MAGGHTGRLRYMKTRPPHWTVRLAGWLFLGGFGYLVYLLLTAK